MTTIPELIRLYIRGFKQLFYYRPSQKGEKGKLSVLKIIIFTAFILAQIFAFLQFTETNIPNAIIEKYREEEFIGFNEELLQLSIYGELAHLMNFVILMGVFYFLLTGDKPLTSKRIKNLLQQIDDFISCSRYNLIISLIILSIIGVFFLSSLFQLLMSPLKTISVLSQSLSYDMGNGLSVVWWIISPILVFSALLVSLDIFANDYPKLMKGYNKKNMSFFIACVIISLVIMGIIATVFNVTIDTDTNLEAPNISFSDLAGVTYNKNGLWWMFLGTLSILSCIFFLITIEIGMDIRKGSTEIRERRKANFLFLFPFILLFVYTKIISATFFFGLRLKSLNNIIDILSLFVVVFFSIFRVLSIQESPEVQKLEGKDWFNPKKWPDLIPTYCKILILFYLAFTSFYATLEANTIIAITGYPHGFKQVRLLVYLWVSCGTIFYVFWRYKPFTGTTSPSLNKRENQTDCATSHS